MVCNYYTVLYNRNQNTDLIDRVVSAHEYRKLNVSLLHM